MPETRYRSVEDACALIQLFWPHHKEGRLIQTALDGRSVLLSLEVPSGGSWRRLLQIRVLEEHLGPISDRCGLKIVEGNSR